MKHPFLCPQGLVLLLLERGRGKKRRSPGQSWSSPLPRARGKAREPLGDRGVRRLVLLILWKQPGNRSARLRSPPKWDWEGGGQTCKVQGAGWEENEVAQRQDSVCVSVYVCACASHKVLFFA